MINFKLYFLIFIININLIKSEISDKRLCVDEKCTVPISRAKALLRYSSPDPKILSFGQNDEIIIYSKSAGTKENLWGAAVNGKRGYIPKKMVREYKVLHKATLLVDTEIDDNKSNAKEKVIPKVPLNQQDDKKSQEKIVEPNKVQDPYEVVDGTTIYLNTQETITPSSIENLVQSTATPEIVENGELKNVENHENSDTQTDTTDKIETIFDDVLSTISNAFGGNQENNDNTDEISIEDEEDDDGDEDNDDDDEDEDEEDVKQKDEPLNIENTDTNQHDNKSDEIIQEKPIEEKEKLKITTFNAALDDVIKANLDLVKEKDVSNDNEKTEIINEIEKIDNETVVEIKSDDKVDDDNNNNNNNNAEITVDDVKNGLETSTKSTETTNNVETTTENSIQEITTETTNLPELEIPPPPQSIIEPIIENTTPNPVVLEASEENQVKQDKIPESPLGSLFDKKLDLDVVEPVKSKQQTNNDDVFNEETVNISTVQIQENQNLENIDVQVDQKIDENRKEEIVQIDENKDKREEIVEQQPLGMLPNVLSFFDSNNVDKGEENKDDSLPVPAIMDKVFETTTQANFIENSIDTNKEDKIIETGSLKEKKDELVDEDHEEQTVEDTIVENFVKKTDEEFCAIDSCKNMVNYQELKQVDNFEFDWSKLNANIFIYLTTTALSVILLLIGYVAIEKNRREGPLVAKINKLEKDYLILLKENELLKDNSNNVDNDVQRLTVINNDELNEKTRQIEELLDIKNNLEEQIQLLEKELENSTEVGLELNRMLSEILNSQNGSDLIKDNIENLQRQLIEQQTTINTVNETLAITNTENHELKLEIELNNKKILDLQSELDKMCLNILKIEEEKDAQQNLLENEIIKYRQLYEDINNQSKIKEIELNHKIELLENQLKQIQHDYELKQKEFNLFKENVKLINENETILATLTETTQIQAELELLKVDNQRLNEKLTQLENEKNNYDKQIQTALEEVQRLQEKYDEADKLRVETQTKLQVLSNYFKEKEAQLQKELSKHESLWAEKEGEATSTTERIKFMQEQLQNYKAQNESLKQEIIAQEVELKSQISVLEKKAHENWMNARQVERKLEDAKQEAAQLRHRLTLSERALQEEKTQHRLQSPIEQNGDLTTVVSPLHIESPASPPLLYGRDHITKSPPLPPGLPPFLPPPPPPGVPFMPPPTSTGLPGIPPPPPPFMPPPNLYPGDHRPPPLGRMSSPPPPLNSRYSPSSRDYSPPYDHRNHSSSPSDSEYGTSTPQRHHRRGYSSFNDDRRDYKRPQPIRSNGRNIKGGSSGSGHSNESLEKINRQQSKV